MGEPLASIPASVLALSRLEVTRTVSPASLEKIPLGRVLLSVGDEALPASPEEIYGAAKTVRALDMRCLALYASGLGYEVVGRRVGGMSDTSARHYALRAAAALGGRSVEHGIRLADDFGLLGEQTMPRAPGHISTLGHVLISLTTRGLDYPDISALVGGTQEKFRHTTAFACRAFYATRASVGPRARRAGYLYPDYVLMGWERPVPPPVV